MWINCTSVCVKSLQFCMTFCNAMGCSLPVSVHGILQSRILEWIAKHPPGDLPYPGIKPTSPNSPTMAGSFSTTSETWEAQILHKWNWSLGTSLVAQRVKNLPAMQETWVWYLCWEDFPKEGNIYPLQYPCLENSMSTNYNLQGCKETWLSDQPLSTNLWKADMKQTFAIRIHNNFIIFSQIYTFTFACLLYRSVYSWKWFWSPKTNQTDHLDHSLV